MTENGKMPQVSRLKLSTRVGENSEQLFEYFYFLAWSYIILSFSVWNEGSSDK